MATKRSPSRVTSISSPVSACPASRNQTRCRPRRAVCSTASGPALAARPPPRPRRRWGCSRGGWRPPALPRARGRASVKSANVTRDLAFNSTIPCPSPEKGHPGAGDALATGRGFSFARSPANGSRARSATPPISWSATGTGPRHHRDGRSRRGSGGRRHSGRPVDRRCTRHSRAPPRSAAARPRTTRRDARLERRGSDRARPVGRRRAPPRVERRRSRVAPSWTPSGRRAARETKTRAARLARVWPPRRVSGTDEHVPEQPGHAQLVVELRRLRPLKYVAGGVD